MGCDIHIHTEQLHEGKWVRVERIPEDWRDYNLFWFLGGIERRTHEIQPIGSYRGLPSDASAEVKKDHADWDADAHSASWLSLKELDRFIEQHPEQAEESGFWTSLDTIRGCQVHEDCKAHPNLGAECLAGKTDHVRIVFWFDN